ncbi:15616_t:CDS:2 [Dentiscutata erythropus]|uniref:15616_t:CDS:1 n=1 Tax=Dentiscutata erythropus TaxID=1348616 RepID=A0A9N9BLC1_9GLOM|nr:15616_t:CDS:2 [Dentiscutata erythropus]
MTKAQSSNYFSSDYYANYSFHSENNFSNNYHADYTIHIEDDFELELLFENLKINTLPVFESIDNSIHYCFDNYYIDYTLHSEDDFGLISPSDPLMAVELNHYYNAEFIEDNYEELHILLDMALEDCSGNNIIEI